MKSPLEKIAERIREEKDEVEAKYSPQVRNHLLQLFRKAQKKDKKLESIVTGNTTVIIYGNYKTKEGEIFGSHYNFDGFADYPIPKHKETQELFENLRHYYCLLCNGLPYIETIK